MEQENKELHEYLTAKPDFDTINRHDFVKYSDEEYTCPKGRRIMKTLDGGQCNFHEFLAYPVNFQLKFELRFI